MLFVVWVIFRYIIINNNKLNKMPLFDTHCPFYIRVMWYHLTSTGPFSLNFSMAPSYLQNQQIEFRTIKNSPTILFSGAGGMILPHLRYFSVSFSCSPRKSLKRRRTANSCLLNIGMLVLVRTRYATYELIPSPIFWGSVTVIIMLLARSVTICNMEYNLKTYFM